MEVIVKPHYHIGLTEWGWTRDQSNRNNVYYWQRIKELASRVDWFTICVLLALTAFWWSIFKLIFWIF